MQQHSPNSNIQPKVLTIGKPYPIKQSFNTSSQPSFDAPASPHSPASKETANFTLQDFLFIPKLLTLGQDVYSMASKGLHSSDINQQVQDRFTTIHDNPQIALNLNVHIMKALNETSSCNAAGPKTYQFLVNVGSPRVKEKFKLHLDTNAESHSISKEQALGTGGLPSPVKSQQLQSQGNCNFKSGKCLSSMACMPLTSRIKKRRLCNCAKRKPLEELMRQERSFNRQVERIQHFWKGGNTNHPFMFKKKLMDYYTETEEAIVSEVQDFSKKAINAEDMQLSISNK